MELSMAAVDGDRAGDQLAVMMHDRTAYVRLRDRGSFKISKAMKQFGVSAIETNVEKIVLDLSECVGMDSTFMGVLAGLAFRLKQKNGGRLQMINLTARTRGLLATLGLDQLVDTHMAGATPQEFETVFSGAGQLDTLGHDDASRRETAEMMLEAHENLVQVSPENLPRFKDVLTFLREDIKKAHEGEEGVAGG
jgi:anti-anti-sigma regulatory factor